MTHDSQLKVVLRWLKEGNSITPLSALELCGSLRLSAIIFEIKKKGYLIESKRIKVGERKWVSEYKLIE